MRGLFTADWQAEWSNLGLCSKALDHILEIVKERRLDFVCLCGDLKRAYNPIDARVVMWWQRAIVKMRKVGLDVYISNGNHDRVGMYDDQKNWLPILRRAGAVTFDKPSTIDVKNGRLVFLPFCTDVEQLKNDATELSQLHRENLSHSTNRVVRENQSGSVLVFHADLKYANYNKLAAKSEASLKPEDLHPDKYLACVGGHIHLAQKLGKNVYYTGSPFCMDWGESNQRKSFLIIEGSVITRVASRIPGWFDEAWPGFPASEVEDKQFWRGSKVRVHVRCPVGQDYGSTITTARRRAEYRYPLADITVVAEFEEKKAAVSKVRLDDPDRVKIRSYVRQTGWRQDKQMVEYLMSKLERTGGTQRASSTVRFHTASASNFLSWKEFKLKFEPGITLITGANGAGKTSLTQPLPVALFGTTFKGQKYDRWARRQTKEPAEVQVAFRDARQRKVRVTRGRRPNRIVLSINGVDHSSGQRGDQKDATQGLIEQVCGFSWQTFANAVFIDPEISRTFLSGTKKQRTEVLNRFQNLERFELAQKMVRHDVSENTKREFETELELQQARITVEDLRLECEQLSKQHKKDEQELKDALKLAQDELDESVAQLENISGTRSKRMKKLESLVDSLNQKLGALDKDIGELQFEKREIESWLVNTGHLYKDKTCPTCYQKLDHRLLEKMKKKWSDRLEVVSQRWGEIQYTRATLLQKKLVLEDKYETLGSQEAKENQRIALAKSGVEFEMRRFRAFHNSEMKEESQLSKKKTKLKKAKQSVDVQTIYMVQLKDDEKFYEYAEEALGRDGIPAFLNRLMVPVLNKAAEYYSELFVDKEIQVRFEVNDGEFEANIINANGGEDFEAQSTGERAVAGLIASFALREAAPRSNVLVLDEPGEGLDSKNARRFAEALRKITKRFESVILTTHNQNIIGELSGERTLAIGKKNGTSFIQ